MRVNNRYPMFILALLIVAAIHALLTQGVDTITPTKAGPGQAFNGQLLVTEGIYVPCTEILYNYYGGDEITCVTKEGNELRFSNGRG